MNKLDFYPSYIDGLMQEKSNSIANTLELRISFTNPLICKPLTKEILQQMLL